MSWLDVTLEPKLTLGELLNFLGTAGAAVVIGYYLQKRSSNERANKDLLVRMCSECVELLDQVEVYATSDIVLKHPPSFACRGELANRLQRYTNRLTVIESALRQSKIAAGHGDVMDCLNNAKSDSTVLRSYALDPLYLEGPVPDSYHREVSGPALKCRGHLVGLQVLLNKC